MTVVVQEDLTGCGIASVAAITNQRYKAVKETAEQLGISIHDSKLWTDTRHVRKLLGHFGVIAGRKEEPFRSWQHLPRRALLAVKWHREKTGPAWHWVVFVREERGSFVLDSKRGLRTNRRVDFGRIKPKWFIRLNETKSAIFG
jgi:ABC-type bacteriocin/lantibiotic exporter with double-glycine peptidase domain